MEARFDNLEYKNIDKLIAGFITEEQKDKLKFHMIASPNITFNDAMQIIQSVTTHFLTAVIKQNPDLKEDVYDAYNFMASSVLNNLIPDYQLRKDMDEEAIMAMEKQMIEEEFAKMTPEQKEKALKDIEDIKARLLGDKNAKPTKDDKKV
jgi:hypothetical protein